MFALQHGNKITKMQLQLLKQTEINLLSSSESPEQDKYQSFHKRLKTKDCIFGFSITLPVLFPNAKWFWGTYSKMKMGLI